MTLSPGDIVDQRYEIIEEVGSGGFAVVFRARHLLMEREAALKVLGARARTRASVSRRFVIEAAAAAQIEHPNVIRIYDVGRLKDGHPYIAMELLEGHDLRGELKHVGPLEGTRALDILTAVSEAAGAAHALGIVHKDLKPANIFLHTGPAGEIPKVVDFGVARRLNVPGGGRFTATGQVFGSPAYLAPEYFDSGEVTPALDVYQIGLITVELLTGRTVVRAPTLFACCEAHCKGDLPIPAALLHSPLGKVLQKALAPAPADRYPDGNALAEALREVDPSTIPPGAELQDTVLLRTARLELLTQSAPRPPTSATTTVAIERAMLDQVTAAIAKRTRPSRDVASTTVWDVAPPGPAKDDGD